MAAGNNFVMLKTKNCAIIVVTFLALSSIFLYYRMLSNLHIQNASAMTHKPAAGVELNKDEYTQLWTLADDLKNFWLFYRSAIAETKYRTQTKTFDDSYSKMKNALTNLTRSSQNDRANRLWNMAKQTRDRISEIQHPKDCEKARLLVYKIGIYGCGLGCTLHNTENFFIQAILLNRTFVIQSKGWAYANEGWDYAFLPLSNCSYQGKYKDLPLASNNMDARVVATARSDGFWFDWKLPDIFASDLQRLHGDPFVWWSSQFFNYMFRLQPWLEKELEDIALKIGFNRDVVGIHVRWGDKLIREADKHGVDEYMLFVERHYRELEMRGKVVNRTVYVAAEDRKVFEILNAKYGNYRIIKNGFDTSVRHSHNGLKSIIGDLYFLSRASYLVCTLSSNVCRAVYELMTNLHADASTRVQSLDSPYVFNPGPNPTVVAIMDHDPVANQELELRKGDIIRLSIDSHVDWRIGFMYGINTRTNKKGKFPSFKVKKSFLSYHFSSFENIVN